MLTARKTAEAREEVSKGAARVTKSPEGNGDTRKTEPGTPPALQELFRRIEGEYREMPGLTSPCPGRAIVGTRPPHMRIRPGDPYRTPGPEARNEWHLPVRVIGMMGGWR